MKEKHTQKNQTINASKVNRVGIIVFFLIFAAVTFYFTFKTDKLENISSSSQTIDKDLYPGLHDYGDNAVQTPSQTTEVLSSTVTIQNVRNWDKIVINYYQGKDVLTELEKFKTLIQSHKTKQKIDHLIANIQTCGLYRPVDIYKEIETLKGRIELKLSEVKLQGFVGETLNQFVNIRRLQVEDGTLKKLNSIEELIKTQNYVEAYDELKKLQAECQCIENYEFILLTRQKNTDEIITDISKDIGSNK